LDERRKLVPVGVIGELYIGGTGEVRTLNQPEEAEQFFKDPFVGEGEARMYRTGELGRWQPDGTIEFLGRNDFQVKIRGYRIGLGEIEMRLLRHAEVMDAAVVAREDTSGAKRLVAYYTCHENSAWAGEGVEESVRSEELRAHLAANLQEYMVPVAYGRLQSMPRTANGEVDREALPATEGDAYALRRYEVPEGEIETALASIWGDLTRVERVGRRDNFFELGGHSLLVTRLVLRIYQHFGVKIDIPEVFEFAELSSLAARVRQVQFAEFDSEELEKLMRDS
jgi:acyl carrier protein